MCLSVYDQFLISCLYTGNKGLRYEILDPPSEKIFHYDDIIPIEILRVWHPSNKTIKNWYVFNYVLKYPEMCCL